MTTLEQALALLKEAADEMRDPEMGDCMWCGEPYRLPHDKSCWLVRTQAFLASHGVGSADE